MQSIIFNSVCETPAIVWLTVGSAFPFPPQPALLRESVPTLLRSVTGCPPLACPWSPQMASPSLTEKGSSQREAGPSAPGIRTRSSPSFLLDEAHLLTTAVESSAWETGLY